MNLVEVTVHNDITMTMPNISSVVRIPMKFLGNFSEKEIDAIEDCLTRGPDDSIPLPPGFTARWERIDGKQTLVFEKEAATK